MRKLYLIITVEFFTDLGNGFISLTLLGLLVFEQADSLSNLVWLRMVEQAPSIILSPFVALSAAMAILGKLTPPFPISWLMVLFGCGFTFMHVLFESLIQKNIPAPHVGKIMSAFLVLRGVCYLGGILGSVLVLKLLDISFLLLFGALLLLTASMLVKERSFSCHSNFHPENSS